MPGGIRRAEDSPRDRCVAQASKCSNAGTLIGRGPGAAEKEVEELDQAGDVASEPHSGDGRSETGTMRGRALSKWTQWPTVGTRCKGSTCGL
jgi:hypothetical protein